MTNNTEIERAERELAKLTSRRGELEERHRASLAALEESRCSRRDALLSDTAEKQIAGIDKRIADHREAVESLEDALTEIDSQILMGQDALSDLRDHQARQQEAEFTKTTLATIQAAAEDFKRSAAALVAALNTLGGRSPEAEMLGAQIAPLAAAIDPSLQQFSRDLLGYISDMQRGGRARVKIPGVKPAPPPVPYVRPDGLPSGTKYEPPLSALRVRHGGY